MAREGKQVAQEESDDNVPIAQRKRKVGTSSQRPRGRGCTTPLAAPRYSTKQAHHARTKHAHAQMHNVTTMKTSL
jgi:hypothetical protein